MNLGWFETSLDVKDLAASIAFYEKLGFQHVEGALELKTVTLNRGDCRLALFQGHLDPPETQLIFWQGDVEAIARDLMAKGLNFERGPNTSKDGSSALLMDPDGHPLFFINMPIQFVHHPGFAYPSPTSRPRAANESDMGLGWFELSLDVADIGRSIEFYRKLGFQVVDDSVARTATLRNADCRISLYQGYLDPADTQLIFWQGDVEAIARDLVAKGMVFAKGPSTDDKGIGAMLFDPDGHPLYFVNIRGLTRQGPDQAQAAWRGQAPSEKTNP